LVLYIDACLQSTVIPPGVDDKTMVGDFLDSFEGMHDRVRRRLEHPETAEEKQFVDKFDDKLDYWKCKFERPDMRVLFGKLGLGNPDAPAAGGGDQKPPQSSLERREAENAEKVSRLIHVLPKRPAQEILADMNKLVGMTDAKKDARAFVLRTHFDAARAVNNLPVMPQTLHTALLGNPGTGKTTLARLRAELLYSLGLAGNKYIEVSRENMIGEFIGHTEAKMVEMFSQADQIFIDEAYNLSEGNDGGNDFGKKVVDALITALENQRHNLVVSLAGYPEEMKKLIASNPGFKSRIAHFQYLPDYSMEELGQILDRRLSEAGLKIEPEARELALKDLEAAKKAAGERDFGNAREVRTMVEKFPNKMAERLFGQAGSEMTAAGILMAPAVEDLSTVKKADVQALALASKQTGSARARMEGIGFGAIYHPASA
jgi:stage V sporulation protein K